MNTKLHTRQDVTSAIERIAVPGGWLYVMRHSSNGSGSNWAYGYGYGHMVFVPDPTIVIEDGK